MFTWSLTYQQSVFKQYHIVTKISQRFTYNAAAKNGGHRHETNDLTVTLCKGGVLGEGVNLQLRIIYEHGRPALMGVCASLAAYL